MTSIESHRGETQRETRRRRRPRGGGGEAGAGVRSPEQGRRLQPTAEASGGPVLAPLKEAGALLALCFKPLVFRAVRE